MNLDSFKMFCDVVRSGSFSRGAAMNRVSQSAVSQAVHQLERLLAVQLIDRTKRPFLLTPEGQVCFEALREILDRFSGMESQIRSLRKEIAGAVRVAAIYSVGLYTLSQCMQEFMTRYPKANVRLQYLHPARVYEAVLEEEADLGILSYPAAHRGLTVIPLRNEAMVLVCSPGHRLADMRQVSLTDLRGEAFIGFDRELIIRRELDKVLRQSEVNVHIVMEFDNIETIKQAVEIGSGISILPEPTVQKEVQAGTLVVVPLTSKDITRPIGIVHRQRKMFTPTVDRFVELLREAHAGDGETGERSPVTGDGSQETGD